MKILFLHMTLGLVNRGSEISTDLIASSLASKHKVLVIQAGKEVNDKYAVRQVFSLDTAPSSSPKNLYEKIIFRLGLNKSSRQVVQFTKESLQHIKKFQPDIIVATNGARQASILRTHFPKTKLVIFGRAGIGHDDLANLQIKPDLFVALSPTAQSWASKIASSITRVVYIPNPIKVTKTSGIKLGLPHPIVLTVGALTKYKNIDKVIKAVSQLQASLLLIGDGEESDHISDLLSKFPGEFRWLKSVEPENIGSYYQSSDIFCFVPDSQEAFGRVYLEAMVSGLPIVASDDTIRREIVGSKGNYANPHDIDSVVSALQAASTQGKIDYSDALTPFNLKNVISNIEREFHALIS